MQWAQLKDLWPFLAALAVSLILTPGVRSLARRFGAVAQPRADRYHRRPTALMGGIAIFCGVAVALALRWPVGHRHLIWALAGAAAMFGLGLLDDLFTFRPLTKLLGQVLIAATVTLAGARLVYTFVPALDVGITVLWLVGITNAVNLLDNLDGLAAGVTAIAAAYLTYFFLGAGQPIEAGVMVSLSGAALGFLVYNWSPASIFMGDSGSLFMGFLLASVTLLNQTHRTRNLLATLAVPLLLLLVPILDTTLVTLARRTHGRAVSQGGTDHISHRLVALGFSDRSTVVLIYLVAASSGIMAILMRRLSLALSIAAVVLFLAALITGLLVLVRVRVYSATPVTNTRLPRPGELGAADTSASRWARIASRYPLLLIGFDVLAVVFCYYLSFLLRFGDNLVPYLRAFVTSLPVVVAVQMGLLWASGVYRTLWYRGSVWDAGRLGLSVLMAVGGSVAAATLLFRFQLLSRAAFAIDAVLLFLALLFGRFAGRATRMLSAQQDRRLDRRTLILGAGAAGDAAGRELRENPRWGMRPQVYLDDDPAKVGRRIRGIPVAGTLADLEAVVRTTDVEVILLAIRELPEGTEEALARRSVRIGRPMYRFQLHVDPITEAVPAEEPAAQGEATEDPEP